MDNSFLDKIRASNLSGFPEAHDYNEPSKEALWALLIYKELSGLEDYITAQDISLILLAIGISRKPISLSRALARLGNMVDKKDNPTGQVLFKIMKLGEDKLLFKRTNKINLKNNNLQYVDEKRIAELVNIENKSFDLARLIQYCNELNNAMYEECCLTIPMLVRAIIDHVPPIFGCNTFAEVTNNYRGAGSFKEAMQSLETSLRKIADLYLHTHIRPKEALPNLKQVDFSNSLDLLLSEVIRILK